MHRYRLALIAVLLATVLLIACGYHPPTQPTRTTALTPTVTVASSANTVRIGETLQVHVGFTNMPSGGTIVWKVNGTTGGSSSAGTISETGLYTPPATAPAAPVTISAEISGTSASNSVQVTVYNPVPQVSGVTPNSVNVGAYTLTVTGANFVSGAQVLVDGAPVTTTFVSATELTASGTIATAGSLQVAVINPNPGAAISTAVTLAAINPLGPVISGSVIKGPTKDATVTAYIVDSGLANGIELGSTTTNASGDFTLNLNQTYAGPVRLVATGGSYVSEADGTTIQNADDMAALLDSASASVSGVTITPLSDMTDSLATSTLVMSTSARGVSAPMTLELTHAQAIEMIRKIYGLSAGAVPERLRPSTLVSDMDGLKTELINGALVTCAKDVFNVPPGQLIHAVVADIADARLDGRRFGIGVKWSDQLMASTAGTSDFLMCLHKYANGGTNLQNAGLTESDVMPAMQGISKSLSASAATPASVGLGDASTNKIMATVSYNGRQFLFVVLRSTGVAMYDVTNPADTSKHKMWQISSLYDNGAKIYELIGGVVLVAGRDHPQLMVYGTGYDSGMYTATLLNIPYMVTALDGGDAGNVVEWSGDTPFQELDSAYDRVRTAVADPSRHGVWFAYLNGIHLVDPDTMSITKTVAYAPSMDVVPESFAISGSLDKLFFPDFGLLNISDLAAGKTYFMDPDLTNYTDYRQVAVDSGYKVAFGSAAAWNGTDYWFSDLSKAVYVPETTDSAGRWYYPEGGGVSQSLDEESWWEEFQYFAADSSSHLVFMGQDFGDHIGVARIQDPASVPPGEWRGFSDWAFYGSCLPCNAHREGIEPMNMVSYDPQRFAVLPNITDGKPYGYAVINNELWRVDLLSLLGLSRHPIYPHIVGADPVALGVIVKIPCGYVPNVAQPN